MGYYSDINYDFTWSKITDGKKSMKNCPQTSIPSTRLSLKELEDCVRMVVNLITDRE